MSESSLDEERVIEAARSIIRSRFARGKQLASSNDAKELGIHELSTAEQEIFACLFLTTRHEVIAFEKLFFGSIDHASVHPRIVVKRLLDLGASAVILFHNHPSGISDPSNSDRELTRRLKQAVELVDGSIIDHIVVAGTSTFSFSEQGML